MLAVSEKIDCLILPRLFPVRLFPPSFAGCFRLVHSTTGIHSALVPDNSFIQCRRVFLTIVQKVGEKNVAI